MELLEKYYDAFLKSQRFLLENGITKYPFDIRELILKNKILLVPLSEYQNFRKNTNSQEEHIKISDGRVYFEPLRKIYLIIYNDSPDIGRKRKYFTLAHELGHIVLGHLNDSRTEINRGGISRSLYNKLEEEADTFAGNLLAPPIIVNQIFTNFFGKLRVEGIFPSFFISEMAIELYRVKDFYAWKKKVPSDTEKILLWNYKNKDYPKCCFRCHMQVFGENFIYCPICGDKLSTKRGKQIFMKYTRIEMDQQGKAVKCPICCNEEILEEGDYCQICGSPLINRCVYETSFQGIPISCRPEAEHLPGNARFCPYCGCGTTFGVKGILKPWEKEIEKPLESDTE